MKMFWTALPVNLKRSLRGSDLVCCRPVCTTEIGRLALKYKELESKGVKLATLSCDPVESHEKWLQDVVAHCENNITVRPRSSNVLQIGTHGG